MKKIKHIILALTLSIGAIGLLSAPAMAATIDLPVDNFAKSWQACSDGFFGFPPWYAHLEMTDKCTVIFDNINQFWVIALNLVSILIRLAGLVALGYIIWSGYKYIRSQGDPGIVSEAKSGIINAVIGLIVVVAAVAIVEYAAGSIG